MLAGSFRGILENASTLGRFLIARTLWHKTRSFVAQIRVRDLRLTLDLAAAEHIPVREYWIRNEYSPTGDWVPSPGDVVVDVGANAGVFAIAAASQVGPFGRVVAIEPNPDCAGRLRRNLLDNGLSDRVDVIEIAAGEAAGSARLVLVGRNSTTAHLEATDGDQPVVTVLTLDEIARSLRLRTINLLKIDVEGSELPVLRGAAGVLATSRRVIVEINKAEELASAKRLLSSAGLSAQSELHAGGDSGAQLLFASRLPESP